MINNLKKPQAIFLMGFIASGKDTQASLLEERYNFLRIRSSNIIKEKFNSIKGDKDVELVKKQYYEGSLIEPKIIAKWVIDDVKKKFKKRSSIVFGGSPRTLYEAENELAEIVKLYGKNNVLLIFIDISEKEARKRMKERLICEKCREIIRPDKYSNLKIGDKCPVVKCGGLIVARKLDAPDIMEVRIKEYYNRTYPAILYLKDRIKFYKINGNKNIEDIHKEIIKHIL